MPLVGECVVYMCRLYNTHAHYVYTCMFGTYVCICVVYITHTHIYVCMFGTCMFVHALFVAGDPYRINI